MKHQLELVWNGSESKYETPVRVSMKWQLEYETPVTVSMKRQLE